MIAALLGDKRQDRDAWIGLSDIETEGQFVFVDGVSSTNENTGWAPGEPNDVGKNEDCAHLHLSDPNHPINTANDYPCSRNAFALCEKPI